jgi:hypothetical protein
MDQIAERNQAPLLPSASAPAGLDTGKITPAPDGRAASTLIKLARLLARQAAAEFVAATSGGAIPAGAAT